MRGVGRGGPFARPHCARLYSRDLLRQRRPGIAPRRFLRGIVTQATHLRTGLEHPVLPFETRPWLAVVECYDFLFTVLAGIAGIYVTIEVLMSRSSQL